MTKYIPLIPFVLCLIALWMTRPAAVIPKCEQLNTPEMCQILERE